MRKRGRKSAAELEIVPLLTEPELPVDAPYDLTDEQVGEWRRIVDALPADFFPAEVLPILAAHCRHITTARLISREIDRFELSWLKAKTGPARLAALCAARDRETRGMLATARSLRLTTQSRYRPEQAASRAGARSSTPEPWKFSGLEQE